MKPQSHPNNTRTFSKGANRDVNKEMHQLQEGAYVDACNMRTNSMDGDRAVLKKILGETILYPNIDNRCNGGTGLPLNPNYECMAMFSVNENLVEIWADPTKQDDSLIRINGLIVLMSPDFPVDSDHPIQHDVNDSCIGGEFYITDFNSKPMVFSVKDLLVNSNVNFGGTTGSCTPKYFEDFDLDKYTLEISRNVDAPVFIKLDAASTGYDYIVGANGLPVGYVSYSFRYVTADGDRSSFSPSTPLIPVVSKYSKNCPNFPGLMTISKDPDVSVPTVYGAHIRFRVNNDLDFDFIEVRRDSFVSGDGIGLPAVSEIVAKIDVTPGEIGVIDLLDKGGEEEVLSEDQASDTMSALERAKAIRYFNSRLYLMNVKYASRDIQDNTFMIDEGLPTMAFPAIDKIGKYGHTDPYIATYKKSYMRGEKYGFGIVLWDYLSQYSYAKDIPGVESYEFPDRRDELVVGSLTDDVSYFGYPTAANINGVVTPTHEVFDLVNGQKKTNACEFVNIVDENTEVLPSRTNDAEVTVTHGCSDTPSEFISGGFVRASAIGHRPFEPTSSLSNNCLHTNYMVNLRVWTDNTSSTGFEPKGFAPDYYSMGIAFKGLESYPSWAKSFSIVRTEPANQIIAQGLGYYNMESAQLGFGDGVKKNTDKLSIYFPDLDADTGLNPEFIDALLSDPTVFEIELVSPLGFFTEVYNFDEGAGVGSRDSQADMITYSRIIKDNGTGDINPFEVADMGIDDGSGNRYVAYGKWRSASFGSNHPSGGNGDAKYDIIGVDEYTTHSGRQSYLVLQLDSDVYDHPYTAGDAAFLDTGVRNWHEPHYVVNIRRKGADIPQGNSTQYKYTGHHQKLSSVIGVSDGNLNQSFVIVDERWEDFTTEHASQVNNPYSLLERFIFVEGADGQKKRWLDISTKSGPGLTTILSDIDTNGFHDITDASGTYRVYGVYTVDQGLDGTADVFFVKFDYLFTGYSQSVFTPEAESIIYVDYDNRIPIKVFGGDTWINESIWAVKDKERQSNGAPTGGFGDLDLGDGQGSDFRLSAPFPYKGWELNPRYFIPKNPAGVDNIQNSTTFNIDSLLFNTAPCSVRQLISMFTAETRINLSFAFNLNPETGVASEQFFPLVNYIIRPLEYDDSSFAQGAAQVYSDNSLFSGYEDDYGDEYLLWQYGGFRFKPQTNIDYSKEDNTRTFTSTPELGFEEQTDFCTRIIWSAKRPINVQDSPSVRTFPSQNVYDISDDTGEIKHAYDCISERGNNLYAFTESGVNILLIDKRLIHEINGNELSTVGSDVGGILKDIWLTKETGMDDETWRSFAEYANNCFWVNHKSAYSMRGGQITDIGRIHYHSKIYLEYLKDMLPGYEDKYTGHYNPYHNEFWVDFDTIRGFSSSYIILEGVRQIGSTFDYGLNGSQIGHLVDEVVNIQVTGAAVNLRLGSAAFNLADFNERVVICNDDQSIDVINIIVNTGGGDLPLVTIEPRTCWEFIPIKDESGKTISVDFNDVTGNTPIDECNTLVWSEPNQAWQGTFSYNYDKYTSIDNNTYGTKNLETYVVGEGTQLNGKNIEAWVVQSCSPEQPFDKEFIRIRINSNEKPDLVEFFTKFEDVLLGTPDSFVDLLTNPQGLRAYNGFEGYVPRKTVSRDRVQGRVMLYKISNTADPDFKIIDVMVQYKKLK